jgi:hypothetical protein
MREIAILKERILQFLDYKGISKYECYQSTGITNGVLSKKEGLSEENLLRFISYYTEVNPDWLLTGDGPMLRDERPAQVSEPTVVYERDPRDIQLISTQEEIIRRDKELVATKDELIAMLKNRISDLEKGSESMGLGSARSAAGETTPGKRPPIK